MRRFSLAQSSLNTIAKRYSSDMAQDYVKRVTLFKVPKSEHIDEARTNEGVSLWCAGSDSRDRCSRRMRC
jgi:hypothetical protein